jgi:glycosyltransferase involved in cell wall biosynthesis
VTILHLATFLQGGAGRMVARLAMEQRRAGHRVMVVTSRTGPDGYGNYDSYLDELAFAGVPVHLVDSMFTRDPALNLAVVTHLDCAFDQGEEPDLIHAHAAMPSLVALALAGTRSRPIAIVQTMHGWGVTKTPAQTATDVALMNLVHGVAVPSEHARNLLASLGVSRSNISVVPYGVSETGAELDAEDCALIAEMRAARRAGMLAVACVGTIGARKNQRRLVEAMALSSAPDVFAVFVGDGDASELAAAIDAAGLANQCRIRGYSAAARRIAAAADLFVLPSRSEGQPVSVLEAFADGTLVAVSDIPELVELVTDGATGLVFQGDTPDSLAKALLRVSVMPFAERNAIRTRARRRFESAFTTAAMCARYDTFYKDVVAGQKTDVVHQTSRRSA